MREVISSCLEGCKPTIDVFQETFLQVEPGWDLIQNNKNLRHRKKLYEK